MELVNLRVVHSFSCTLQHCVCTVGVCLPDNMIDRLPGRQAASGCHYRAVDSETKNWTPMPGSMKRREVSLLPCSAVQPGNPRRVIEACDRGVWSRRVSYTTILCTHHETTVSVCRVFYLDIHTPEYICHRSWQGTHTYWKYSWAYS